MAERKKIHEQSVVEKTDRPMMEVETDRPMMEVKQDVPDLTNLPGKSQEKLQQINTERQQFQKALGITKPPESTQEVPKTEITESPEDIVKSYRGLNVDKLYGKFPGKLSIEDYTPEEKAKLERRAKQARWADAAMILGRALQGKDIQLDKTLSGNISNQIKTRRDQYLTAANKLADDKAAWDMKLNEARLKAYLDENKRQDISEQKRAANDIRIQELEQKQQELQFRKEELQAKKEGNYYSPSTRTEKPDKPGKDEDVISIYQQAWPTNSTNLANYINQALSNRKDAGSSKNSNYVANWINSFKTNDGSYAIPYDVIESINNYFVQINQLNQSIKNKTDLANDRAKLKQVEKELKEYIISKWDISGKSVPSTSTSPAPAQPIQPTASPTQPTVNQNDQAVAEKWGV